MASKLFFIHPFPFQSPPVTNPSTTIRNPPSATATPPTRRAFLQSLLLLLLPQSTQARPTCLPPDQASINTPFTFPPVWPYTKSDFARFDTHSDSIFYSSPRLVRHIDPSAQAALAAYYATLIPSIRDILDLCSSVEAYLPSSWPLRRRVIGLGMNATELEANPALTDTLLHDLNQNPTLPFPSASFDLVLCALSIDYLTQPREVLADVARVLRPGGKVVLSFSNRVFGTKAVAVWMAGADEDHIYTAASFLHYAGGFSPPQLIDLSPRSNGVCTGDPLYVVQATRL